MKLMLVISMMFKEMRFMKVGLMEVRFMMYAMVNSVMFVKEITMRSDIMMPVMTMKMMETTRSANSWN
ncbi:hypothetical protein MYX76_17005 [Desulfobacterota bacterium AH_259_B03_O07]|nr:hypothetical protein [Desulfobacterota bacterium AH_259_B03_O07]